MHLVLVHVLNLLRMDCLVLAGPTRHTRELVRQSSPKLQLELCTTKQDGVASRATSKALVNCWTAYLLPQSLKLCRGHRDCQRPLIGMHSFFGTWSIRLLQVSGSPADTGPLAAAVGGEASTWE